MKKICAIAILILLQFTGINKSFSANARKIDIALCLDLSGSTNGMIDKLREYFWEIVNETSNLSPKPDVRIGLVGYGRPSYGKSTGFVKIISDLTNDYDSFYESIIAIHGMIESGDTYVGKALENAVEKLSWSPDADALKFIFVVGNGPVNFGGMQYIDESEVAVQKGIFLTPVFVKNYLKPSEEMGWEKIAKIAGTKYEELNINKKIIPSQSPFNLDYLRAANMSLDSTFFYYGPGGRNHYKILLAIDDDAARIGINQFHERLIYKTTLNFQMKQLTWDLVSLSFFQYVDFETVDRVFIQENIKDLSNNALQKLITATRNKRTKALNVIKDINQKRKLFITEKNKTMKTDNHDTFDGIILNTIKRIAGQNGFSAIN